jgi:GNAT superfamily N-acetyltransferase
MIVRKIDTNNRRDINQFIQFPFDLYHGDPLWVPPLRADIKFSLDRQHYPFYQHSEADFFVAERDGHTVGRIAAINNRNFNEHNKERTAFFYFFDAVNDQGVAEVLFEAVSTWARKRDLLQILGPKGMLQIDGNGMLVEGFEYPPAMGIAYNYPYYHKLITAIGFKPEATLLSGLLTAKMELGQRVFNLAERIKERRGFRVENFHSKEALLKWGPELREVYNAAFDGENMFTPVTSEEMSIIANRLLSLADPRLIKLIFKEDEIVGFLFAYHNIAEGLRKANGSVWPFGWFHIWRAFKTTKWVDINGIGLLPQHQGSGAVSILYVELEKTIRDFGFDFAETIHIRDNNVKSMAEMKTLGVQWYKRHQVYQKNI